VAAVTKEERKERREIVEDLRTAIRECADVADDVEEGNVEPEEIAHHIAKLADAAYAINGCTASLARKMT